MISSPVRAQTVAFPGSLRVQELAHDSLIAATGTASKECKTSSNGETLCYFFFPVFYSEILVRQWLSFELQIIQITLLMRAEG